MPVPANATLGTLLRHLIETLDGSVQAAYADLSLNYRPRYTPVLRVLRELGSASIRTISQRAGITHSAVSQTVSQMSRDGLIEMQVGNDARERIVALSPAAIAMLPALETQWAITNAAAQALDDELSMPLSQLLREAIDALERQPFKARMSQAKASLKAQPAKSPSKPTRKKASP
jgi:DNA-binding MarR family transcriptional regulator